MIHETRFELPPIKINLAGDILVFDKPYRCTSFDLVAKVKKYIRKIYQTKVKVGHAGTLDPLATGVMIICVGSATKTIETLQAQEKEYTGTFCLGGTTASYDMEKPVGQIFSFEHITKEMAQNVAQSFIGETEQIPPHFSAVKVDGKRAYELARQGKEVEIKPKKITISHFEITRFELPYIDFKIICSKGTYIRAIARDFGNALNSGAYLSTLRRTRIGDFLVKNAIMLILE